MIFYKMDKKQYYDKKTQYLYNIDQTQHIWAIINKINRGEIVILPTETVYGLFVLPKYVDKIFELKQRPLSKSLSIHCNLDQFHSTFNVNNQIKLLANKIWPGPYTLLFQYEEALGFHSNHEFTGKIAVRVPDHHIFYFIASKTGVLCGTSANISNKKAAITFQEAKSYFSHIDGIDDGTSTLSRSSILIDVKRSC